MLFYTIHIISVGRSKGFTLLAKKGDVALAGRIRRHMEDCCHFVPFFWGASSERSGGAAPALTPVQSHRVELSEHFACESPSPIVLVLVLLLFCLFCYQIAVFR